MKLLSSIRNLFGSSRPRHQQTLAHAERKPATPSGPPTIELLIWVLVNDQGAYVAGPDPLALNDEYKYLTGGSTDFSRPVQLVKVLATVPLPRPIEMTVSAN